MLRHLTLALLIAAGSASAQAPEKLSRLQGDVRLSRSKTVVGATIVVRRASDPGRIYLTSSGTDGAFFIDRLPDGEYSVRISREGYAPVIKQGITLKYPFRAVVEVTMEPGTADLGAVGEVASPGAAAVVRGSVKGPDGAGLGEAWVRLVRQDGSVDPVALRTPADGTFAFEGLAAGEWRLEVLAIGYLPLRQRLMFADDTECLVQLVPQPQDYEPSPLDLMPPEVPVVPEGFGR